MKQEIILEKTGVNNINNITFVILCAIIIKSEQLRSLEMLDRISDCGTDSYVGFEDGEYVMVHTCGHTGEVVGNDYFDHMADYIPMEDDDRREWADNMMALKDERYEIERLEMAKANPSYMDMINTQVEILKQIYGDKR